jgi:hypothetical protein
VVDGPLCDDDIQYAEELRTSAIFYLVVSEGPETKMTCFFALLSAGIS